MIRLAATLVLLQLADVVSTMIGLAAGAIERNPVGVALLRFGPWGLLLAKVVGTCLIIYVAARVAENDENGPAWARVMLVWSCFIMAGVVLWNGSVILARI